MDICELHSFLSVKWMMVPTWRPCCKEHMGLAACWSLGGHNRPRRRWLRQTFISHSSEAEKSRITVLAPSVPSESPLSVLWIGTFSLCSGLFSSPEKKPTTIKQTPPSGPHLNVVSSPRPSSKTITLGVRASTRELYGDRNIQSITPCVLSMLLDT